MKSKVLLLLSVVLLVMVSCTNDDFVKQGPLKGEIVSWELGEKYGEVQVTEGLEILGVTDDTMNIVRFEVKNVPPKPLEVGDSVRFNILIYNYVHAATFPPSFGYHAIPIEIFDVEKQASWRLC